MVAYIIVRRRIVNGEFTRVGQLLHYWHVVKWAKILNRKQYVTCKKIDGTYKFILRDAAQIARYFQVSLNTICQLMNAEIEDRKKRTKENPSINRHFRSYDQQAGFVGDLPPGRY
jgi:hypothetical protein